jgi:hypothetical protein
VKWTVNATFNSWSNVTLQAAALVGGSSLTAGFREFRINADETGKQFERLWATKANSSFIATWLGCGRENGGAGDYGGRFDCAGNPL